MPPPKYPPPKPKPKPQAAPAPKKKKVAAPKVVVPPKKPIPVAPKPKPLTLEQQAQQQVNMVIDPQVQANTAAASASANTLRAAYAALSQMQTGVAPQIQNTYTNAANSTAAFAKGFSDLVQNQSQGAASTANQGLQNLGSPQEVVSRLATGGGDALYGMGGYIPASQLAREGAAFTSAASNYPAMSVGLGVDATKASQAEALANLQKIQAQRPELLQQALQNLQEQRLAQQAAAAKAAGGTTAAAKPVKLSYTKDGEGNFVVFNPVTGRAAIANPPGYKPKPPKTAAETKVKTYEDSSGRPYTIVNGKVVLLPIPPGFTTHTPGSGGSSGGGGGSSGGGGGSGGSGGVGAPGKVIFKTASGAARYAENQTSNSGTLWKVRPGGGGYEAYPTGKPKAGASAGDAATGARNPSGGKLYAQGTAYDVLNTLSLKSQGTAISKWKIQARNVATNAFKGNAELKLKPISYQAALAKMTDAGIPLDIAQQALNKLWKKPGVDMPWEKGKPGSGRPAKPFQVRNPSPKGEAANAAYTITYTGGGGTSLVNLLKAAGFQGEGLRIAYGIAMRESGGRPEAFNGNTSTGDRSWGLFQINTLGSLRKRVSQFGLQSEQDLLDPLANARAAYRMSNAGTDFGAWGIGRNAYRSGAGFDTIKRWYDQFPGGYV